MCNLEIRPVPGVYVCNLESEIRSTEGQGDVWISLRWMLREWVMSGKFLAANVKAQEGDRMTTLSCKE
jgi:hypothetical protein